VGQNKRPIPAKLGPKLKAIRSHLGLTGAQLIERLDCPSIPLNTGSIAQYEQGFREPSLIVLVHYARLAKIHMEVLADDEIDLQLK
jgi:transcriptional regulator with XRE-family HTH domain